MTERYQETEREREADSARGIWTLIQRQREIET